MRFILCLPLYVKGRHLSLVYFSLWGLRGIEVCIRKEGKGRSAAKRNDAWTRALAVACLHTRAFSKSAIYISWLHELKEWSRSGFLNMAAGRPCAVIQSHDFSGWTRRWLYSLPSAVPSSKSERPWSPPSIAISFSRSSLFISRPHWRFTRAKRDLESRLPICCHFSRLSLWGWYDSSKGIINNNPFF